MGKGGEGGREGGKERHVLKRFFHPLYRQHTHKEGDRDIEGEREITSLLKN